MSTSYYLYLRCADVGIERSIDSFTDERTFGVQTEVLKQHGDRENLCQWIREVLAGSLWPRSVNRLKKWRVFAQRR